MEQKSHHDKMRIFISIVFFIIKCQVLFSQEYFCVFFVDAVTNGVPVYSSDTCANHFTVIKESEEKENWHSVTLLEKSDKRYKVYIELINNEDSTEESSVEGWVDREQCGVWPHGKYVNMNLSMLDLYKTPFQSHPFLRITSKYQDDFSEYTNSRAFPVLDYKMQKGRYWIKTVIIKNKKRIIGWTQNYCDNIYGACN